MATIITTLRFKDMVSANLARIKNETDRVTRGFESMSGKLVTLNSAIGVFNAVANTAGRAGQAIGSLVGQYDHMVEMETRLQTVMNARMGATEESFNRMKDVLNQQELATGYSYEMLTNGAQELATYISDAKTLEGLMPVLANMAKQAGVNSEQGMMSYATMLGKVMGGDMGGMSKRGYVFSEQEKQAFKLMNEQERLAFLTKTVTESIGDQANALMKINPKSLWAMEVQLGNVRKEIGGVLKPFMNFYKLTITTWKVKFYENIIKGLNFIKENANKIIIVIGGIGVALVALGVYFTILKLSAIKSAIATATAWALANLPIIAMIAGILAVIGALTAMLVYSEQVFPAIGGLIGGLAGWFGELGANIKRGTQVIIEWMVNAFLKMKDKLIDVFLSIFDTALTGIMKLTGVMGKLLGTDMSKSLSGFKENINALKGRGSEKFTLDWEDNRQGFGNAFTAGKLQGQEIGKGLSDKLQGGIDKLKDKFKVDTNKPDFGGLETDSSGALITADKNVLELSDEYKELLSTEARRKFSLNFSQTTPEVNVGDININNNMDAEQLIADIAQGIEEASSSTLWSA